MNNDKLYELLKKIENGQATADDVMQQLKTLPFDDMGYAKIDNHRQLRTGYPEVVFCQGKTIEHICGIAEKFKIQGDKNILFTRADEAVFEQIAKIIPDAKFNKLARIVIVNPCPVQNNGKKILVLTAGTSDIPVAEEAATTAEIMGNKVERIFDVGVAGLHRLLSKLDEIRSANVIIAVAGMEGALVSVIAGLVDKPVIAVPTSVGYGTNFGGLSALLGMLNSCGAGVSVVNIDNGFGAGHLASIINNM